MAELKLSEASKSGRAARNVLGQPERLLKRQQGEADKEQKRKEKEATDAKRLAALQKQATLMEKFLRIKREPSLGEHSEQGVEGVYQFSQQEMAFQVSNRMDQELTDFQEAEVEDILRSHVKAWKELHKQWQRRKIQGWGGRRQPKGTIFNELRLGGSGDTSQGAHVEIKATNLPLMEVKDSFWDLEGSVQTSEMESEAELLSGIRCMSQKARMDSCTERHFHTKRRKLLQFDQSYRPAYYGTFSQKSGTVRPCKPFARDSTLDYQIDSDEEWEEDDPGESLSDCDMDEEDIVDAQDEDDIPDGFVVPDGYLSETEGVHLECIEDQEVLVSKTLTEDTSSKIMRSYQRTEDLLMYEKKLRVLGIVTDQALRSNRACMIENFGQSKLCKMINRTESLCLQALKVCMFTPNILIEPPLKDADHEELPLDTQQCKWQKKVKAEMTESELLEMVDILLSSTQGLEKTIDLMSMKIPNLSRTQLRKSVREICKFAHKRWQVKKEVLEQLGLRIPSAKVGCDSPGKATAGQLKPITKFFSKRCLPPAVEVSISNRSPTGKEKQDSSATPCKTTTDATQFRSPEMQRLMS